MKYFLQRFNILLIFAFIASCSSKESNLQRSGSNDSLKNDNTQVVDTLNDHTSRNAADFSIFINYFLNTCYYNNNLDSLVYHSSAIISPFIHKEAGFGRYFNEGAFCNLYTTAPYNYLFNENYQGKKCTYSNLPLFNKKPKEGFCEESRDPNGVYFYAITEFPDTWNHEEDKALKTKLPPQFEAVNKIKVDILFNQYIDQQFYFAQIDKIWYLIFIYDCDCSA